jgi:hypothetical protein
MHRVILGAGVAIMEGLTNSPAPRAPPPASSPRSERASLSPLGRGQVRGRG